MKLLDKLAYKILRKHSNEDIKTMFNIKCKCVKPAPIQEVKTKTLKGTAKIDRYDMRVLKDYKTTIKKEIAYDLIDEIVNLIELEVLEDNRTYRVYSGTLKFVRK